MVEDIVGLRELSEMLNPVEAVSLVLVEADDPLEVLVCILMHIASKVLPSILVPPYDVLSAVLTLAVLINCGMLPEVLSFKVVSTGVVIGVGLLLPVDILPWVVPSIVLSP